MSRGSKNFYAVRVGRKPGIYTSWPECEKQVKGYKNARFKGFATMGEAKAFMNSGKPTGPAKYEKAAIDAAANLASPDYTIAYCDGSYNEEYDAFSYGVVIMTNAGEYVELSKRIDDSEYAEYWNIAGEIHGAMAALQYCEDNKLSPVILHYDYEGIGAWATGEWRAKSEIAADYIDFLCKLSIEVYFQKVRGHSGDPLNERCDELARRVMHHHKEGSRTKTRDDYTYIDAYLDRFYPISRWTKSHIVGRITDSYPKYAKELSRMLLADLQHWFLVQEEYLESNTEYRNSSWYLAFNSSLSDDDVENIIKGNANKPDLDAKWKKIAEYDNDLTQSLTIRTTDTGDVISDAVVVSVAMADGKRGYKAIRYSNIREYLDKPTLFRGAYPVDAEKMKAYLLSSSSYHVLDDRFVVPSYVDVLSGDTLEKRINNVSRQINEDRTPFMVRIGGTWFVYLHRNDPKDVNYPLSVISDVVLSEVEKNFHPEADYRDGERPPVFYDSFTVEKAEPRADAPDRDITAFIAGMYYPINDNADDLGTKRASIELSSGELIEDAILLTVGGVWRYTAAYRTDDALNAFRDKEKARRNAVDGYADIAEGMRIKHKNCLGYSIPMDWPVGKKTTDIALLEKAAGRLMKPGTRTVYTDSDGKRYIAIFNGHSFDIGDEIADETYNALFQCSEPLSRKLTAHIDKSHPLTGFRVIDILNKPLTISDDDNQ